VLAVDTLIVLILTLIAGQEPGILLGVFTILGSIAATLGIKRGKVYLLFPAPALAFFTAAVVTGKVHDAKLGSSTAGLGVGFTQWVAGIFFPAVIATVLVLLIGGGRWLFGRQLITGLSALSSGDRPAQGNARPVPGGRRPAVDEWADDDPFKDRAVQTQIKPVPGQGRPARPPRDRNQGADRDPWGDPRLPADRSQPTGPRPSQSTGPRPNQPTGPRPSQSTGPRPNQPTGPRPRPADRPSPDFQPRNPRQQQPGWNPNERPKRPVRPQPPDGWTQR
jgi:hypothetical protein